MADPAMSESVGMLIEATALDHDGHLNKLGHEVGKLLTDHGLPVDMALNRTSLSRTQKLAVVNGVCEELIAHKRRSGATEKALARTRKSNRDMIDRFIRTGETGAY